MKQAQFRNPVFYWMLIAVLIYTLGRNALKASFSGDPMSFVAVLIEIVLFALVLSKHEYAKDACYVWAAYFILRGGSMAIGLCLEHGYNGFVDLEAERMIRQILRLIYGISIALYGYFLIDIVEVPDPTDQEERSSTSSSAFDESRDN